VSYVVNGSDLHTVSDENYLLKYAEDTYLIIPAVNVETRSTELNHITEWAKRNNLKLNLAKTHEIIFVDRKRKQRAPKPVEISQLHRVNVIKILGVTMACLYHICSVGNCIMCTSIIRFVCPACPRLMR